MLATRVEPSSINMCTNQSRPCTHAMPWLHCIFALNKTARSATGAALVARMVPIWIAACRAGGWVSVCDGATVRTCSDPAAAGWQRQARGMWAQPASRRGTLLVPVTWARRNTRFHALPTPGPESLFRGRHGPPQPRPRTSFINGGACSWLAHQSSSSHSRGLVSSRVLSQVSIPASCSACSFLVSASQTVTGRARELEPEPGAQRSGFWHSFLRCS